MTVVVASSCAVVNGVVGDGSSKLALESDCLEIDACDIPDASNVEDLGASGADGVGNGGGVLGEKNEFILTGNLVDNDVVVLVFLLFGVVDSLRFNETGRTILGGGEGGECGASELLHI